MKPFRLEPAAKDYLWGGTRLKEEYNKRSDVPIIAETWELSAHPDGPSVIVTGENKGMSFGEYISFNPQSMGTRGAGKTEFPLLIKLIDAKKDLSVQVHPDDDYAARVENGLGKTEMWVVLDHEPGAGLYCGFAEEPTLKELRERIATGSLTEVLNRIEVERGDVVFIPAGTIHAIGAGILLAEIQQNSNSTYRVYDYGRRDKDGKLRPLHVDKALDVLDRRAGLHQPPGMRPAQEEAGYDMACLVEYTLFQVWDLRLRTYYEGYTDGESFLSLLCVDGNLLMECDGETLPIRKGDCVYLPADTGPFLLEGTAHLLMTML